MRFWFLLFLLAPIIEMYLLIQVGGYIGAWPTIGLVVLTAMFGVTMLRHQGLATLTRGMGRLEGGALPAQEMVEGLLLAVAGVLLITPGFVTDTLGLLLLVPMCRGAVARRLLDRVVIRAGPGGGPPGGGPFGGWSGARSGDRADDRAAAEGDVIEGEFESHTEPEDQPRDDRRPR